MSNIKGLFSAKRDHRLRQQREKIATGRTKRLMTPRMHREGRSSPPDGTSHTLLTGEANSPGVQAIAAFASQAWQEALHKENSFEQEKLFSLATVLLDALANAKEAERAMLEAQKAASAAEASHELTQHSLSHISRLLRGGERSASLLQKT